MGKKNILTLIKLILILSLAQSAGAQSTVLSLFKTDRAIADEQYDLENYRSALDSYLTIATEHADAALSARIARCQYFLRHYHEAAKWYAPLFRSDQLRLEDLYYYAETLVSLKKYSEATSAYRAYLKKDPENEIIIRKIWRLDNIGFLYEDSLHYSVTPVDVNSVFAEIHPAPYREGLIFMSNRKKIGTLEHIDAATSASFFHIYYSRKYIDSSTVDQTRYATPELLRTATPAKFHQGPAAFFDNGHKMVLALTGIEAGRNGKRTLQLFFEELRGGKWVKSGAFQFNNSEFSITDPSISNDGSVLFFSSDMPGGKGGKDLYSSHNVAGRWTKPLNLSHINTPYDETSPYIAANGVLYFSSNGHPGLGGLDIFKVQTIDASAEIQNLGYPMNSTSDDFGIVIDSLNIHGYLSSNRGNSANDDIYEFDIDLQTYPLTIAGVLKYRQATWTDSLGPFILPKARLTVIDHARNIVVYQCTSDSTGSFSIVIPYFSTYKIKVTDEDNEESIVSLEIPKHRIPEGKHEIVVVKDPFESKSNEVNR